MTACVVVRGCVPTVLLLLLVQAPVLGVIEAKFTLAKSFADAKSVHVGKVSKWAPATGEVVVDVAETISGDPIGERCRINASTSAELKATIAEGQRVLIMPTHREGSAILHAGDTWFLATFDKTKSPPILKVLQHKRDLVPTYPGRTDVLAELYRQVKASKPIAFLERIDPKFLTGGIKDLGTLPGVANATALAAGDFDGDKKLDLAVATKEGVKTFTFDGKSFAPGNAAAPTGFPAELPKPAKGADDDAAGPALAAVAGADFTGANGPARIVVRRAGIFREPLDGQGDPQQAKAPVDDFKRLTGDPVTTYPLGFDKGVQSAAATAIDVNGDGRKDVAILTESSGIVMVNRGYGAFFVIPKLPEVIAPGGKLPFAAAAGTHLAAADLDGDGRDDLIAIDKDGRVWAVMNPAAK